MPIGTLSKQQGARGSLAVGGSALHNSAIYARFCAAGNTSRRKVSSIVVRSFSRLYSATISSYFFWQSIRAGFRASISASFCSTMSRMSSSVVALRVTFLGVLVAQTLAALGFAAISDFASNDADFTITPAAVPQPESHAMLLAGLGLLSWIGARRTGSRNLSIVFTWVEDKDSKLLNPIAILIGAKFAIIDTDTQSPF